jgi:hypothetical protein
VGEICPTAIFVAMNDPPQTMTAKRASRKGRNFVLCMESCGLLILMALTQTPLKVWKGINLAGKGFIGKLMQ